MFIAGLVFALKKKICRRPRKPPAALMADAYSPRVVRTKSTIDRRRRALAGKANLRATRHATVNGVTLRVPATAAHL
ncbi:unnamed protein product, partial [Iphiclides podalirius]